MGRVRKNYQIGSKRMILGIIFCFLFFLPFNNIFAQTVQGIPYLGISVAVNRITTLSGNQIIYTITYKNTGDASATGIIVKNPLTSTNQDYLEFLSANPVPDSGNDTWIIDGPLKPGESGKITLTTRIKATLPSNWLTIRNLASIDSNETNLKYSNYVSIFITSSCRLSINQTVRNITGNTLFGSSINAKIGDEIEFISEIKVIGSNQAANTKIWNRLSSRFKYVSGSGIIDGLSFQDETINDGIYVGDLLTGTQKTVRFRATVDSSGKFYIGKNFLRSYGYVDADICMAKSSIATVIVDMKKSTSSLGVMTSSGLSISNFVRNITKKSRNWSSGVIYVNPGDEVEFLIKIKSSEENDVSVRVEDILPPKMLYIPDSTTVDGNYESDGITTKNIYLAHVYINTIKEIKFKAKILEETAFNIYPISLVNKVSAWGNSGMEISDSVKIIVNPPTKNSSQNVGVGSDKNISQSDDQDLVSEDNSGEVKGAATIKTGFNYIKILFIFFASLVIASIIYCVIREQKLLQALNDRKTGKLRRKIIGFYFRSKLLFRLKLMKLKKR